MNPEQKAPSTKRDSDGQFHSAKAPTEEEAVAGLVESVGWRPGEYRLNNVVCKGACTQMDNESVDEILERVAYHEAGHAVVGIVIGRNQNTRLRDFRVEEWGGFTEFDPILSTVPMRIITAMAGGMAQERHFGLVVTTDHVREDEQQLREALSLVPEDGIDLMELRLIAESILVDYWEAVEVIASAVLEIHDIETELVNELVLPKINDIMIRFKNQSDFTDPEERLGVDLVRRIIMDGPDGEQTEASQ